MSQSVVYSYRNDEFTACTIANNNIGGNFVFESSGSFHFANNIVAQPGKNTVNWLDFGGQFDVSYVLSNSIAGLPQNNPSVVQGTPLFVDAANGDYHLTPVTQKALDFGGSNNVAFVKDIDGNDLIVDLPNIPNFLGASDLGAYQRQNLFYNCGTWDSPFCDGFNH